MKRRLTTREKVMLGLLAGAAIFAYRMLTGEGIGFGAALEDEAKPREFGEPPAVNMDLLKQGPVPFDAAGRNLFAYHVPPAPPPRYTPPPVTIPAVPPRVPSPPPPPPPPVAPQAPQPRFNYLGNLGPKDGRIAVFDAGEEPLHVRIGDIVEQEFRLLEFKHDSVILGYTDEQWQGRTAELKLAGVR